MMADQLTVQFQLFEGDVESREFIWHTPKASVLQLLHVEFEAGRWHISGGMDDGPTWHGYADNQIDAVLDWLADRMGRPRPDPTAQEG